VDLIVATSRNANVATIHIEWCGAQTTKQELPTVLQVTAPRACLHADHLIQASENAPAELAATAPTPKVRDTDDCNSKLVHVDIMYNYYCL
jgi:hypothetical protein